MKPKILVAATARWFSTPRLAMALADAGCVVDAVCPPNHPLEGVSAVRRAYPYRGLAPLTSFADALDSSAPDLVIPSDDLAANHLHALFFRERARSHGAAPWCAVIERSLGAPESLPLVYQRSVVMEMARREGVRVPKTRIIADRAALDTWIEEEGLPTVLKSNGSSGGEGVRVPRTPEEARRALTALQAPPILARTLKHALIDRDLTLVLPFLSQRKRTVNAQTYIPGNEATSLVVAWKGKVLAALHFEVIKKQDATGPASVLRLIEHPDMAFAAETVVRNLGLSGFQGFDFMLEAATGNAYLIELNPRTTQVGHLRFGPGRDLPGALYAAVTGTPIQETSAVTKNDTIALFPQEWSRSAESPFLHSAYHDVPWQEPELMRACLRKRRKWSDWSSQRKWLESLSSVRRLRL